MPVNWLFYLEPVAALMGPFNPSFRAALEMKLSGRRLSPRGLVWRRDHLNENFSIIGDVFLNGEVWVQSSDDLLAAGDEAARLSAFAGVRSAILASCKPSLTRRKFEGPYASGRPY
jgi:hypothetical protein